MKLNDIKPIAERVKFLLQPYCLKCEIAGSIRRQKEECKDIEIVVAVHPQKISEFSQVVYGLGKVIKGKPYGKYMQIRLIEGIMLDLFIAEQGNFGNIFLIRTGSADFSKRIMGSKVRQMGYIQKDGYMWRGTERLNCPTEQDVFDLLAMDYIEPKNRVR